MSAAAPILFVVPHDRRPLPAAVFEFLAYFSIIAAGALAFLAGWLSVNGAVVLTVLVLGSLVVLAWTHLGQGRHPVLLFLCSIMLFQGGRLIAYCLGAEPEPMRVVIMTVRAFSLSRDDAGLVLLAVSLSAVCIYAPCRWLYRPVAPPSDADVRKYLPYLYLLFSAALPVQLFKNYRYYEYVQQHGGYAFIYVNHGAIAASVPFWVRGVSLLATTIFAAIFVFERRRLRLMFVTLLYLVSALYVLMVGARGALFGLVAVLWWVTRVKTLRKTRIVAVIMLSVALLFVGFVIQKTREEEASKYHEFNPVDVVRVQGNSLNVTEVAIKYASRFGPYFGSYMLTELQNAFVPNDVSTYQRGRSMANDVSVLLNVDSYRAGYGTAGSYIGEAYLGGGIVGVVLVSLAIGLGLHAFYRFSGNMLVLYLFTLSLPDILMMPKGQLFDWVSILLRDAVAIALLWLGWKVYSMLLEIQRSAAPAKA